MRNTITRIEVDEKGHLVLPPEVMRRFGLVPGAQFDLEEQDNRLSLQRTPASLSRVYLEPTNLCNLDCRICMRHVWDESLGKMAMDTFQQVMQGIKSFSPLPSLFFGGIGEPMAHPHILDMLCNAKENGVEVELITNGTLLDETAAQKMVEMGVNRIWVSIDGASPESYADVRLGDALPQVIANVSRLRDLRTSAAAIYPRIGIAFVAMQRNITDLAEVMRLGLNLGADQFFISNVLPHTPELQAQILYLHSLSDGELQPSQGSPVISLPRIDVTPVLMEQLPLILRNHTRLHIAGQNLGLGVNTCPFAAKGSTSIRWDGAVSPCVPLMHSHESYLGSSLRKSHSFSYGNVNEHSLAELWSDPAYVALRERLRVFDFSPCAFCHSCELSEANAEDCFGNSEPACGGCLWAQGFIQCP